MSIVFWGVDIETSGTVLAKHKTIQIGIAAGLRDVFVSDIGWAECVCEEESLKVTGFTRERILAGPSPSLVDSACWGFANARINANTRIIPVGWNVAGFDMPFVRRDLPTFAKWMSYRSVDLNAICFALDGRNGHKWDWWKEKVKKEAERLLGVGGVQWHDAGFDAVAALLVFGLLKAELGAGRVLGQAG